MIDYVIREDVLEILSRKSAPWDSDRLVRELPAADVCAVVRCRDCKNAERVGMADGCVWCNENLLGWVDDEFCSRGEKREDNDGEHS